MTKLKLATWSNRTGRSFYGDNTNYLPDLGCSSIMLQLRSFDNRGSTDTLYNSIGLYVWFDKVHVLVAPRLYNVHTMELCKLERLVKILRVMCKATNGAFQGGKTEHILLQTFKDIKLTGTVLYSPSNENRFDSHLPAYELATLIDNERKLL